MYTPPVEALGQVLPVFFSTLEMVEYRDACEAVFGKLTNVIHEDDSMNEEYKRKLERHLDSVFDLSARLNLALTTERIKNG